MLFENIPGGPGKHAGVLDWRRAVSHSRLSAKTDERFDSIVPIEQVTVSDDTCATARREIPVI
jgi:hypothetical protein